MAAFAASDPTLRAAIRDLYEDYARCLDDLDLEGWLGFFTEDARYIVTSRENHSAGLPLGLMYLDGIGMLKDRVVAIRETTVYEPRTLRHFVSGVHAEVADESRVRAGANFVVYESLADAEPRIALVGAYIDELVVDGGGYRFRARTAIYDNYRVHTSLIIPV